MGTESPRIWAVEDDASVRRFYSAVLGTEGFSVRVAETADEFRRGCLTDPPEVAIVDLGLPDASGLEVLRSFTAAFPEAPAIVITGSSMVGDVIAAMKLGAFDYIVKPVDRHRLLVTVRNAIQLARQRGDISRLRSDVEDAWGPERLVGSSHRMEHLRNLVRRVATVDVPVLIAGETGTGKELVARALHHSGRRKGKPFVGVNCAAITESLMGSELFGHEKGAFTGAEFAHAGLFEQANGGSVFLDEIGDLSLSLQPMLLRVLQEQRFLRVGGERAIDVDVRILCATNQDLERLVETGRFRRDLFFRINGVALVLPPLRERTEDIAELADHFLRRVARRQGHPVPRISADALDELRRRPWPGNVRELEYAVERALIYCDGDQITLDHLAPRNRRSSATESGLLEAVARLEESMIRDALEKSEWVKARAARTLGITERMIAYKMAHLGIRRPENRTD